MRRKSTHAAGATALGGPSRSGAPRAALLAALCALGALGEALGASLAHAPALRALAAETTALPTVAAFHDDRLILVFADRWWAGALFVSVALLVRSAELAVFIRLASADPSPAWRPILGRALGTEALLLACFSPWATLSFLDGVVSLSWLVIAGLAGALVTAVLVMPHGGIAPWWWARLAPARAMGWTLASFLLVSFAAWATGVGPPAAGVALAGCAGLANATCWRGLVRACHGGQLRRPRLGARVGGPVVLALSVPLLLLAGIGGFGPYVETAIPHRVVDPPPLPPGRRVLLFVDGFMSDWGGRRPPAAVPGYASAEFSYRGQAPDGRPLPYASGATTAALPVLGRRLARQVDRLARRSGHRVEIVAVSEGTLVVWRYLATHPSAPVGTVALASPLLQPDRVAFPPPGVQGPGMLAGLETRALVALMDAEVEKAHLSASMGLARSLMADALLYRGRWLCPLHRVRTVAFVPLAAALADPPGPSLRVPAAVVAAVHGGVLSHPGVKAAIGRLLHGRPLGIGDGWRFAFGALRGLASAWEVPTLALAAMPSHGGATAPLPSCHGAAAPVRIASDQGTRPSRGARRGPARARSS